jgi:hypothetical protein
MARNGSGTYTLPAGNPVVTGSTISSTWANNTLGDIGTALTGSIAKDGQTTPTANLPMGTYAHTGVGNASVRTMYGSAAQVQDNTFQYLTSVSGTNTITATAPFGMTAYATGQRFTFIAAGANTGATTLNLNSIGAKAITKNGTTPLVASDIASGQAIEVVYDGTQFQLLNPAAAANVSSFSAGSTGLTPSTATTGAVTLAGTLAVANGGTGVTTSTGSGNNVLSTSPTLVTPALGTPSALVGTNITGTANSLNAGIGVNQTWTDVKTSPGRVSGTTYTNSTGKPIQVFVSVNSTTSGNGNTNTSVAVVSGVTIATMTTADSSGFYQLPSIHSFIVPNSGTYSITNTAGSGNTMTIASWTELR